MSVSVIPATAQHLEALTGIVAEGDRERLCQVVSDPATVNVLSSDARTLLKGGEPIATFGVWPQWQHVGRAWALLTAEVLTQHPKTLHRSVLNALDEIESRDHYRRIEAVIRDGHEAGHRWIQRLGFAQEGLMRNYGAGDFADFYLYARLSNGTAE